MFKLWRIFFIEVVCVFVTEIVPILKNCKKCIARKFIVQDHFGHRICWEFGEISRKFRKFSKLSLSNTVSVWLNFWRIFFPKLFLEIFVFIMIYWFPIQPVSIRAKIENLKQATNNLFFYSMPETRWRRSPGQSRLQ